MKKCIERNRYETCINPHEILYHGCTEQCQYYAESPPYDDDDKIILGEPDKIYNGGFSMMGWICPRCGKVWAYFIDSCNCHPPSITRTSYDTTGE